MLFDRLFAPFWHFLSTFLPSSEGALEARKYRRLTGGGRTFFDGNGGVYFVGWGLWLSDGKRAGW